MKDFQPYFFEEAGVILSNTGDPWKGKGDSGFRSCHFAITRNRTDLLLNQADLLMLKRRWPAELDDPRGPEYEPRKLYGIWSMTRDPYIMFYAAAWVMEMHELIDIVRIPWYLYRPHFRSWRKYLITGKERFKKRYEFWHCLAIHLFKEKAFVLYLDAWLAWIINSEKVMTLLRPQVPHWNYCVKLLLRDPLAYLNESFINTFLPRQGFIWQSEEWVADPLKYLTAQDDLQLDREILLWVYEQNKRLKQ